MLGGLALPAVVLVPLVAYGLVAGERLLPLPGVVPPRIEVRAERWGWAFRYPDHGGKTTAGVLHLPVGTPVDIMVTSRDVIHAFWIPRLAGKIDAIPGRVNVLRIQVDAPGRYEGTCAEFCGTGHAGMRFEVVAHPAGEFAAALARAPEAQEVSAVAGRSSPGGRALRLHRELAAIWATGPGLQRLASVNHSVIGVRIMVTAFVFFAIAGLLGMLTRVQLATPAGAFMSAETYNQVFTLHGSVMLFLFVIPMLEGMAVYLTPKILGTRDFAFPRLTAYSYWCYLFGAMIVTGSLLFGVAPDGGWFMYTPLSSSRFTPGVNADIWLLGVTFVEISALSFAVEIVVSILKMRAPGMSLDRMPIFGWYILATAAMMVVAFPPLILASILLEVERAFGLPFFDPTRGGDALLWQHLFWLFGHPDVYIIFLPMAAVLSTILPVFAGRPLVGYRAIVVAIVALAFMSFGIWVHHMFTVGIPHLALAFFSAGSAIVAVPTVVQMFAWLGDAGAGAPALERADALRLRLLLRLRAGRPDRRDARHRSVRLAGARHLLRRRPPALRRRRRLRFSVLRGAVLLAAAPHRTRAGVSTIGAGVLADLHRIQPDVPRDAPGRAARHAATRLHLSPATRAGRSSISSPRSAASS